MAVGSFLEPLEGGCRLSVIVTAGATNTELVGVDEWRHALHIRVAARRTKGEANEELVRFLAEKFSVGRSSIRLLKGEKSTQKLLFIPVPPSHVMRILGGN